MVRIVAFKDVSIRIYKSTIAVHLMVKDLSFINRSIVHDVSSNTIKIPFIVKLTMIIGENLTCSKFKVEVDIWHNAQLTDILNFDRSKLLPFEFGSETCFFGFCVKHFNKLWR